MLGIAGKLVTGCAIAAADGGLGTANLVAAKRIDRSASGTLELAARGRADTAGAFAANGGVFNGETPGCILPIVDLARGTVNTRRGTAKRAEIYLNGTGTTDTALAACTGSGFGTGALDPATCVIAKRLLAGAAKCEVVAIRKFANFLRRASAIILWLTDDRSEVVNSCPGNAMLSIAPLMLFANLSRPSLMALMEAVTSADTTAIAGIGGTAILFVKRSAILFAMACMRAKRSSSARNSSSASVAIERTTLSWFISLASTTFPLSSLASAPFVKMDLRNHREAARRVAKRGVDIGIAYFERHLCHSGGKSFAEHPHALRAVEFSPQAFAHQPFVIAHPLERTPTPDYMQVPVTFIPVWRRLVQR